MNQIYFIYLHTHKLIHNIISLFIKSKMSLSSENEVQRNMNRHYIKKNELSISEDQHILQVMRESVSERNTRRNRVSFGTSGGNLIPDDEVKTRVSFIIST